MSQEYYKKYLKYKNKYIELKKQMGGLTGRRDFNKQVPQFKNNTNDEYKNAEPRNLNTITYADYQDYEYTKLKTAILYNDNQSKINQNINFKNDFIETLKYNPQKILTIIGFFNVNKKYDIIKNCGNSSPDDCGLDVGTVVAKEDIDRIFKPGSQLPDGFNASRGMGKINLNEFCKEMNENISYLMLDAAGDDRLRALYERYGFKTLMTDYFVNLYDDEWSPSINNSLMIGKIDDIITATN